MEGQTPTIELTKVEEFERKRCGYFANEFSRSALYWSSLCETMQDNEGSTEQVLAYIASRLETDRIYSASVYAHADKIFGDKKGAAKLRHDHIRDAEQKAKQKGEAPPQIEDAQVAGGAGRDIRPKNSTVKAIWEMAEMDCRAARYRDMLCDELEEEHMLGKVKAMNNETRQRLGELISDGAACLQSLRSIDQRVGHAFVHLKEILGNQLGGQTLTEDVWFLNTCYHTAVVHQKEAWAAVNVKLREVFSKLKDLETNRRAVLREFLVGANKAILESWNVLPELSRVASESAAALGSSSAAVDADVEARMSLGVEEKKLMPGAEFMLENVTNMPFADPSPSDDSFIDGLTAPLESPLVRTKMMIERREGQAFGSKYYPGLMVLSWQGFIHFFDIPENSKLKKDVSPAAALQDISPTVSVDDLLANRRGIDEVLTFKSTHTLHLNSDSMVTGPSSKKSQHKIEVKGRGETTSIKRHFGSSKAIKTVTFRTSTEAQMNHALDNIKWCIQNNGGMGDESMQGRCSLSGRSSFGSVKSDKESSTEQEPAPAPAPAPSSTTPPDTKDPSPEETTPPVADPVEKIEPSAPAEKVPEDKGKEVPVEAEKPVKPAEVETPVDPAEVENPFEPAVATKPV